MIPRCALLGLVLFALGCGRRPATDEAPRAELMVFAAASLRDALVEATGGFEDPHHARVAFNFAASNALAQQLAASPQADLFVSASPEWMDDLERRGLLAAGTRRDLLGNELCVIASRATAFTAVHVCELRALPFAHLVLADPAAVPAGKYARAFLERVRCPDGASPWSALEGRVLPMPDVRAALAQVEARADAIAIVYRTDAHASREVRVLFPITGPEAPHIRFPAALLARRERVVEARSLLEHLASPAASGVFARHGFVPLGAP